MVRGVPQPVLGSIVVSISACHVEDPGSIPGRGGDFSSFFFFVFQIFYLCMYILAHMISYYFFFLFQI